MKISANLQFVKRQIRLRFVLTLTLIFIGYFNPEAHGLAHSEMIQIHGFATQGFILSSDNRFFGNSEEGSFRFSELGVNTSIHPRSDFLFSAQVLSRQAGESDKGSVRLDYGMLNYQPVSNESGVFGLLLGRVKNPLGFYNDTRDVAFTRPSIFLPESIYFDRTRNIALSSDGVNLYSEYRATTGNFFYELGASYPDADGPETATALLGPLSNSGALESRPSYLSRFIFEQDGGKLRLGISGAIVNIRYKPNSNTAGRGRIRFLPLIFSAQYNAEHWSLTSEYARRYFKFHDVFTNPGLFKVTGESFYFQHSYRITQKFETLLRYDLLFQNRDDRDGRKSAASSQTGAPDHSFFAKDWTAGLRWDMSAAWMSRIEYHYVNGTAWLPTLDNPSSAETKRYWDLFAFLISYRF